MVIDKAFIYLIRSPRELLILAHPDHPEAGLQIPAGTIKAGESPYDAACRELVEETGLQDFKIEKCLGETLFDMHRFGKAELHRRFFFQASLIGDAPQRWLHYEASDGLNPIVFEFFWWNLEPGFPDLIAGHG